jgi:predicted transcriptional regulator
MIQATHESSLEQPQALRIRAAATVEGITATMAAFTFRRLELLGALRASGPMTILGLSKSLARDYKNVHTDVTALMDCGVIQRGADGLVCVPWDRLVVEVPLPQPAMT